MKEFWLCFIPMFVAVDAFGLVPFFISLTNGLPRERVQKVIIQSVITASVVAGIFVVFGLRMFNVLGIGIADMMIAGGILLFIISIKEIVGSDKGEEKVDEQTLGAVPIGIPLIAGPAVLTTCVLMVDKYQIPITLTAAVMNVVFAGIVFWFAAPIARFLGRAGTKTISKLASFLLAAIAVMFVHKGILLFLGKAVEQGTGTDLNLDLLLDE